MANKPYVNYNKTALDIARRYQDNARKNNAQFWEEMEQREHIVEKNLSRKKFLKVTTMLGAGLGILVGVALVVQGIAVVMGAFV